MKVLETYWSPPYVGFQIFGIMSHRKSTPCVESAAGRSYMEHRSKRKSLQSRRLKQQLAEYLRDMTLGGWILDSPKMH